MEVTVRSQCLRRIGNVKKYKIITFDNKTEVTIGRNPDVTVCILSTMISRCHAVLKKTERGTWTIKDNKSLNGIFINSQKLEPLVPYELKEGDIVQLGVRTSPDTPPEFVYQYHNALKVKRTKTSQDETDAPDLKKPRVEENDAKAHTSCDKWKSDPCSDSHVSSSQPCVDAVARVSGESGDERSPGLGSPSSNRLRVEAKSKDREAKRQMEAMEAKLREMQEQLQAREAAQEAMAHQLAMEKVRRELQTRDMEDLRLKEEQLKLELEHKQEEMARERAALEVRMREELEDQLSVREANLVESLELQKQALVREKREVEERLQRELASERERDKQLTEQLQQQQHKLQKVIEAKEAEQRLLESQLQVSKTEKDLKHEEMLRAREEVLSNFAELMETELQCSICSELFVRAMSLNCSHAFCSLCIRQWMDVKKECPICRTAITTHMRSIVLDSYIDKMVEQLSDELQARRQSLVEERKKDEEAFDASKKPAPPEPGPAGGRRGRGRGRRGGARVRGGGGRGNNPTPTPAEAPPPEPPIVLSDEEDEDEVDGELDSSRYNSSMSNSGSEEEISGDEYAYFGGYGRCFNCGSRGHWANGCPYR